MFTGMLLNVRNFHLRKCKCSSRKGELRRRGQRKYKYVAGNHRAIFNCQVQRLAARLGPYRIHVFILASAADVCGNKMGPALEHNGPDWPHENLCNNRFKCLPSMRCIEYCEMAVLLAMQNRSKFRLHFY